MPKLIQRHLSLKDRIRYIAKDILDRIHGAIYGGVAGLCGGISIADTRNFKRLCKVLAVLMVCSIVMALANPPIGIPVALFMTGVTIIATGGSILLSAVIGLVNGLFQGLFKGYTELSKNDDSLWHPFEKEAKNQSKNTPQLEKNNKIYSSTKDNAYLRDLIATQQAARQIKEKVIEMTPGILTQGAHRPTTTTTSEVSIFSDKNLVKPISDSDRPSYRLTQKA